MSIYQIFDCAERCLHSDSIDQKLNVTSNTYHKYSKGQLSFDFDQPPKPICATRFPNHPELVEPRYLPRRSITSKEGRIGLLHAIAHIEFYAIHLAWDIIYRFQGMPQSFYTDWLGVAHEEAQHFSMIRSRLRQLDSDYGLLKAHRGLWEVAENTDHDVLARLALVPRYMEAKGLDVTPGMIDKLLNAGDERSARILETILKDEVRHVRVGSQWFHTVCEQRGVEPEETYFDLLTRYLRGKIRGPFNHQLRKQAGFTETEIRRLEMFPKV